MFSTVGDILSTVGSVQYRGGYHEYRWGYLVYRGGYSVPWGYHDARGGYHEYRGGVQYCGGINLLLFEYPTVLMIYPDDTQITKDGILPQYCTHVTQGVSSE